MVELMMTELIRVSVDDYMSRVYELTSDKRWAEINPTMYVRPYFDKSITEVWMVVLTFREGVCNLGVFKQYESYTVTP